MIHLKIISKIRKKIKEFLYPQGKYSVIPPIGSDDYEWNSRKGESKKDLLKRRNDYISDYILNSYPTMKEVDYFNIPLIIDDETPKPDKYRLNHKGSIDVGAVMYNNREIQLYRITK